MLSFQLIVVAAAVLCPDFHNLILLQCGKVGVCDREEVAGDDTIDVLHRTGDVWTTGVLVAVQAVGVLEGCECRATPLPLVRPARSVGPAPINNN